MSRERAVEMLTLVDRLIEKVEVVMSYAKTREDRLAIAVRLAGIEQKVAAARDKWGIPSPVTL